MYNIFDFAIKVFNGTMENSDENVEHVFRVIYESIKQYFKEESEKQTKQKSKNKKKKK